VTRNRIFWIVWAVLAFGVLATWLVWIEGVTPWVKGLRAQLREAEKEHEPADKMFQALRRLRPDLLRQQVPNRQNIVDIWNYIDWLQQEGYAVAEHFHRRSRETLLLPLTAKENPDPSEFEAAFNDRLRSLVGSLPEAWRTGPTAAIILPRYPWLAGPSLPEEGEFEAIRRDLAIRFLILRYLKDYGVTAIHALTIGAPQSGPLAQHIPVTFRVSLPPNQVLPLLESLLELQPGREPDLAIVPRGLVIEKHTGDAAGQSPTVNMEFRFDVLNFPPPVAVSSRPGGKP